MDDIKKNNVRKRKIKQILCYFGLVMLTILLFLPLVFRIVFKDKSGNKDVITTLTCRRNEEVILSSFVNDDPANIKYTTPGKIIIKKAEEQITEGKTEVETEEKTEVKEETKEEPKTPVNAVDGTNNQILNKFMIYSNIQYDANKDLSIVQFNTTLTTGTSDWVSIFSNIVSQENYFTSQEFSCNKTISK